MFMVNGIYISKLQPPYRDPAEMIANYFMEIIRLQSKSLTNFPVDNGQREMGQMSLK